VFAHLHRHDAGRGMMMVGRADRDRVNFPAQLLEHLAVIAVEPGFRVLLRTRLERVLVHVAERHNVVRGAMIRVAGAFATGADHGNVQFFIGRFEARAGCAGGPRHQNRAAGKGRIINEFAACDQILRRRRPGNILRRHGFMATPRS